MNGKIKKVLLVISGTTAFLLLGIFGLDYFIGTKIKNQLNQAPDQVKVQYLKVEVSSIKGTVKLVKPVIWVNEKLTQIRIAKVELNQISVKDFSYWNYFFKDKISLGEVLFDQPKITYFQKENETTEAENDSAKKQLDQIIRVEYLKIKDAHFEAFDSSTDSLLVKVKNLNFQMNAVEFNPSKALHSLAYSDFKLVSDSIFYRLNVYDNLTLDQLIVSPNSSKFRGITLKTKYTPKAFSKQIPVERDHYDVSIDSIEIQKQRFGFDPDSLFYFKCGRLELFQPDVKIFRDKLVADNLKEKPLYSKMIRDLNLNLLVDAIFITNASITYTEKVKADTDGGRLLFSKVKGEIKNLGNKFESSERVTSAQISGVFMGHSPANIQLDFAVHNPQDEFVIKGEMGNLNAKSMNQFMEPNLGVQLKGEIQKAFFTINGNDHSSQIDLKLKYEDFDVIVLTEDQKRKNKLLSGILQIFIAADSKDAPKDFRHGSKSGVERARNKSLFNYLWLNLRAGLLDVLTGDGKK